MTAGGLRLPARLRRPRIVRSLEHGQHADLVDHLGELRTRLLVVVAATGLAFIGAFIVHESIIEVLNRTLPPDLDQPITIGIAEPFLTSIKVSLWAAVGVAMPVILWQAWGFCAPAFDKPARRTTLGFVLVGSLLFALGAIFSYAVALPSAVNFLTGYDTELYDIQVRARDFYTFAAAVIVSIGLVFQLPVVLLALVRLRVLRAATLRRNRRIAYVSLTALAVLLPGVDPVLTLMELVPIIVLFEATLFFASRFERRWDRVREAEEAEAAQPVV